MGQAVSAARKMIEAPNEEAKANIKQQMDFLVDSAQSKLDQYQAELESGFMDKDSISKKQVPGIRALRFERGYRVSVSNGVAEGIKDIVSTFFEAGKQGDGSKVADGFAKVVQTGLEAFLGNTQIGQTEEEKFFVFVQHHAIIRIDIKMWKYNFSSTGVIANSENVMAYIFCLSVVDHNVLANDELLFLLAEYSGDEEVAPYIESIVKLWDRISNVRQDPVIKGPRVAALIKSEEATKAEVEATA